MAETPSRAGPAFLGTSAASVVTAGGATTYKIVRTILVCNEDSVSRSFTLGVNTSATDTAGKRIAGPLVSLGAGQTWEFDQGWLPLLGHATTPDMIYGLASAASAISVTVGVVDGP